MRQYYAWLEVLQTNPLFEGIAQADIATLLGSEPQADAFGRGDVLFSPDRYVPALAFMLEGSALVYKAGGDGSRLLMSRLLAGQVFGMASLFCEESGYPTEIHAETACRVLFWPKEDVEAAFARSPALSRNYIRLLSERIHFLNRRIDALSGDDLPARLLHVLEELPAGPDSATFTLPYSLSQLAELLGVGRASLYRALDTLEAEGRILRNGKQFTLCHRIPTDKMEESP